MTAESSEIRRELVGSTLAGDIRALLRAGAFRPLWRASLLGGWTGGCLAIALAGMGVLTPWPVRRRGWLKRMAGRWARGIGRIAGMRVTVSGPLPEPPFFLVSNHLGYLDIVLLMGLTDAVFVAKGELTRWPVIGYLARLVGTIFIDRTSHRDVVRVLDAIDAGIARSDGIVVFPEARSSGGDDVAPFKAALFEWPARTGSPVQVATIGYRTPAGAPPAREAVCWWGEMSFLPHLLALCRLPGFDATVCFEAGGVVARDRSLLAEQTRALVAARLAERRRPTVETA